MLSSCAGYPHGCLTVLTSLACRTRLEQPASMASDESYSVWLEPSGKLAENLQREITTQSQRHAVASFQPHVTLLGGIKQPKDDAISATEALSKQLQVIYPNTKPHGLRTQQPSLVANMYMGDAANSGYHAIFWEHPLHCRYASTGCCNSRNCCIFRSINGLQ